MRRGKKQDHQQRECMNNTGNRSPCAGADVGGRTGDCACGRQSAEQRRKEVGDALANQLDVGIMFFAFAEKPVRHHGRHQ